MKHVKSFENYFGTSLDIENEYSKLVSTPTLDSIDLGVVGEVSDSTITNIKQTYKDAIIEISNGHYILKIK